MTKQIKIPTTYDEQINILKSRKLLIPDIEKAKQVLASVNYYSFSGYLFTHQDTDGNYSNISFDDIYDIYLCDKRIKSVLMYAIELVEHNLKTKLAYVLAHELGSMSYMDKNNFTNDSEHNILIKKFNSAVKNNQNLLFVKHHLKEYNTQFPIWVAVELFTLGMVWNCYKTLKTPIKKKIAHEFNIGTVYLESWIECVAYLRNMSAHYMRLYRTNIQKTPKKSKDHNNCDASNRIFDIIYIMKFLSPQTTEWNNYIIPSFAQIFSEYATVINLSDYGFPNDWEQILKRR